MSDKAKLFMRVTGKTFGEIAGGSIARGFVDAIEIDDWSWSIQLESDPDNGGQKVPMPSEISFGKLMDPSTTPLLAALRAGEELTVTITLFEAAENQFGLVVQLKEARLVDYRFDARNEEKSAAITEDWKLDYRTISFDHRAQQGAAGSLYELRRATWAKTGVAGKSDVKKQIGRLFQGLERKTLQTLWKEIEDEITAGKYDIAVAVATESDAAKPGRPATK